ncbi:histidine phosphatase family protein [Bacillus sp. N1-1]|jgi:broad specificity phosphatase PhoE|uniref:histidine phosphatase family protein n=1 Tax=Bacillus sp. N1-1 TaxID=2682541 RepID=UPI0013173BCC|nr:histidine phosphatase family protein [Bacillus sp. N1-1]QHA93268.1 histidine phosphatase family protein [Bacillus sp. N1-1]
MELIFVRHGQAQHTLDTPNSLQMKNPSLTKEGKKQAYLLRDIFHLKSEDTLIISPTQRTLETAQLWKGSAEVKTIVSPMASPRMFPQKKEWWTLPCDVIMKRENIEKAFPAFNLDLNCSEEIWKDGINTLPEKEFRVIGEAFLRWCKQEKSGNVYVVSHDGTITSYRQLTSKRLLTRDDFPKDAGWIKVQY